MNEDMLKDVEKAAKRGAKRGSRAGGFKMFLIGLVCGIVIMAVAGGALIKSHMSGKSLFEQEGDVEGYDLTLENNGILGFTAVNFAEAILGERKQLKKIEVYSVEVSDVATITDAGFAKLKIFSKYQYITYNGTAIYTVDLSNLSKDNIVLDEDNKTVIMTIPSVKLEPINIPSEDISVGDVERGSVLALGKIKMTAEDTKKIETEAKNRMLEKLEEDNVIEDARTVAQASIWEIFQPVVSGVSPEYTLEVRFVE